MVVGNYDHLERAFAILEHRHYNSNPDEFGYIKDTLAIIGDDE
jgi:hypothetical protein